MQETWKDIPGYEGRYQASDKGRIRSIDRAVEGRNPYTGRPFVRRLKGRTLRPGRYCKSGHLSVVLGKGAPGKPVHQLVMLTFQGPPPVGTEICHANGNPTDNRLENLRYDTRRENILDVYRQGRVWRKLSTTDAIAIKRGLSEGASGAALARKFGVSQTTISRIKLGRIFAWVQ